MNLEYYKTKGHTMISNVIWLIFIVSLAQSSTSVNALDNNSNGQPHPHGITSSGLNTIVKSNNNQFDITGGIQKGNNLFHSFGRFNIHSGESARFHDAGIQNTIGKVTGNQYSWINGQLSSHAENLYLINPNGWMFGPNASLDIAGSFHVSSADYLEVGEKGRFDANNPEKDILTAAPVQAFGFLDSSPETIPKIIIQDCEMNISEGKTATFISNGIEIDHATIKAPDGNVNIVSIGSEGIVNTQQESHIDVSSFKTMNHIMIKNNSKIEMIGNNGGNINIYGHSSQINESLIQANSGNGGMINIELSDQIISNNAYIISFSQGDDQGADISIKASSLLLQNGIIGCLSYDDSKSGNIDIQMNESIISDGANSGIIVKALDKSLLGDIQISSNELKFSNGAQICITTQNNQTNNFNIQTNLLNLDSGLIYNLAEQNGKGMDIHINATDSIHISDQSGERLGINSYAINESIGGKIVINTPSLTISNYGSVSLYAGDNAQGTDIQINASQFTISDNAELNNFSVGDAISGKMIIQSNNSIILDNNGIVSLKGFNNSTVGDIKITSSNFEVKNEGKLVYNLMDQSHGSNLLMEINTINISNDGAINFITTDNARGESIIIESENLYIDKGFLINECRGDSKAVDMKLKLKNFNIRNGGYLSVHQFDQSKRGLFDLDVQDLISFEGTSQTDNGYIGSAIYGYSFGDTVDQESLTIKAKTIELINGGMITSSSMKGSNTGRDIHIIAQESILISRAENGIRSSIENQAHDTGTAGDIYINAPQIILLDGGCISGVFGNQGNGGLIDIKTDRLELDGGLISNSNMSKNGIGKPISIEANESIVMKGSFLLESKLLTNSQISADSFGENNSSSITIKTPFLYMSDEATISNRVVGSGDAGDILIYADTMFVENGLISSNTVNDGKAGDITIHTKQIRLENDSEISSDVLGLIFWDNYKIGLEEWGIIIDSGHPGEGRGNGGKVEINATQSVNISGLNASISTGTTGIGNGGYIEINTSELSVIEGLIDSTTVSDNQGGDAGTICLNIDRLSLKSGGQINATSASDGHGGSIQINATDMISISGLASTKKFKSGIQSRSKNNGHSGNISIMTSQLHLYDNGEINISSFQSGNGLNIDIQADQFNIFGNGRIVAEGYGSGDAGNIKINTINHLNLINGFISTHSKESDGGNIDIQAGNRLMMKESQISTSVEGGLGNGGNILVDSEYAVLNKSQIIANAYEGNGGNITIISDQLVQSSNSMINASSQLGIHGNIMIQSPELDLSTELSALNSTFMDATHWLNKPCELRSDDLSSFIIRAREALPQSPDDLLTIPIIVLLPESPLVQKIKPFILKGFYRHVIQIIESDLTNQVLPQNDILAQMILATTYLNLGFKTKAQSIVNQMKKHVESNDSFDQKALFYATSGDIALSLSNPLSEVSFNFTTSAQYATLTQKPQLMAASMNHLANYYAALGRSFNSFDFAHNYYKKALDYLNKSHKNYLISRAVILINLARIQFNQHLASSFNSNKSQNAILQAIHAVQQLDDHWYKGFYLVSLYDLIRQYIINFPDHAVYFSNQINLFIDQCLNIAKYLDHPLLTSYGYGLYGDYLMMQNQLDLAIQYTQKAFFVANENNLPEISYIWKWNLAKLLTKKGMSEDAKKAYLSAIQIVKPISHQFYYAGRYKSDSFKKSIQPLYNDLISLKMRELKANSDEPDTLSIVNIIEQIKIAELQNFYKDECIEEQKGSKELLSYLKTLSSNDTQNQSVVIYPLLTDPPVIIALFEEGSKIIPMHTNVSQIKNIARNFYNRLTQFGKPSRINFLGAQLYETLIKPLKKHLNGNIKTLIFVSDDVLRLIPYAALYDSENEKYLCETFAVVTLPALSLTQKQSDYKAPMMLLGGLSQSTHDVSNLPNVSEEIKTIQQIMGGTILQEETFTLNDIQNELNKKPYNILHFCTHGTFGSHPELIQLNTFNKPIYLDELNKIIALCNYRKQPIDLLTLSACDTARGDERAILGLGGVAVKTGAKTAIASLWQVEDKAASEIMISFYHALKNNNGQKAKSLQEAQMQMINSKQFSHPSYWSPFILIGDWK